MTWVRPLILPQAGTIIRTSLRLAKDGVMSGVHSGLAICSWVYRFNSMVTNLVVSKIVLMGLLNSIVGA